MLNHFVFLKYSPDAPQEHIDAFCERMQALRKTIPQIESLEIGRDEFGDERSWNLILAMTFQSVTALRNYQSHPDHVAVMEFNAPWVRDVGSVDYHSS